MHRDMGKGLGHKERFPDEGTRDKGGNPPFSGKPVPKIKVGWRAFSPSGLLCCLLPQPSGPLRGLAGWAGIASGLWPLSYCRDVLPLAVVVPLERPPFGLCRTAGKSGRRPLSHCPGTFHRIGEGRELCQPGPEVLKRPKAGNHASPVRRFAKRTGGLGVRTKTPIKG
jgi:hypothetical protein